MKRDSSILVIMILLVWAGCGGNKRPDDGLFTIDVMKSYPKKELILQDIYDVEYIPLETSDAFITTSLIQFVDANILIMRNVNIMTSPRDIFIFDRHTGKALHKISHYGSSPGEYIGIGPMVYDNDCKELFVLDYSQYQILVYDLEGNFKRRFAKREKTFTDNEKTLFTQYYSQIFNYDREHLLGVLPASSPILEQEFNYQKANSGLHILSKQSGSIVRQIELPLVNEKSMIVKSPAGLYIAPENHKWIIPFKNQFFISSLSSDTVYNYLPEKGLIPFIVKTPSIHSMSSPETVLTQIAVSERYYFIQTVKLDASSLTKEKFQSGSPELPTKNLVYDRKDKTVSEYVLYNADISDKTAKITSMRVLQNIFFLKRYEAYELKEYFKKGALTGRLKEVAAGLNEEDNPVIMIVTEKRQ